MEKNLYDRQPFPHEDDASFDRTLQTIASQELMPRPGWGGFQEAGRTSYEDFYGDTYHWDHLNLVGLASLATKLAFAVAYSTIGGAALIFVTQPLTKPLVVLWRNFRGIIKYTLFIGAPVPERYDRFSATADHRWRLRPFYEVSFKECLRLWYGTFTKRVPVFLAGTWIGSKFLWAMEDQVGEDALIKQKTPFILFSGFAALFVSMSRNNLVNFVKAPVYAFGAAFSAVWLVESLIVEKGSFDAFWNPLRLHLPSSVVSLLVGDPFNGELIVGPLKYASINALNTAASTLFEISRATQNFASSVAQHAQGAAEPTQDRAHSYATSLEKRIELLEEEALAAQGFLAGGTKTSQKHAMQARKEHFDEQEAYEQSWINPLQYLTPQGQQRLSLNTLEIVSDLFGPERISTVATPLHLAHSTDQIIFGNLNDGIQLATDPQYIETVRAQLEANAASQTPQIIGKTTRDKRFFVKVHEKAKFNAEAALIDPIGWLLTPLVSLVEMLPGMHFFRGSYAFDDYSAKVSHRPLWSRNEEKASQVSEQSADSSSPSTSNSASWQLSEEELPLPYDIPPILTPEAVERQKARILLANKTRVFSIDESTEQVKKLVTEDIPLAAAKAGSAIARGVEDAGEIVLEASNALFETPSIRETPSSSNQAHTSGNRQRSVTMEDFLHAQSRADLVETLTRKYVPEDEYFRRIKASVDQGAKSQLPAGVTAEDRLMNFLENVGGQNFEEPTEQVLRHKIPRHFARERRFTELPIVGETRKNLFKQAASNMKKAIGIRVDYISRIMDSTTTYRIPNSNATNDASTSSPYTPTQPAPTSASTYDSSYSRAEGMKSRAAERLERIGSEARNWFAELKSRFTSEK